MEKPGNEVSTPKPAGAEPAAPVKKVDAKPRPEFRHPVLNMMGISRIRLPGRNWLIFWAVTGSLVSGYYWDRYERKKVRDYWVNKVAYLGEEHVGPLDLPRKVTVYMAPPPNDYLDATDQQFRNFIKPVLTSAAIDHEIVAEERQGHIRTKVSEQIRDLRRKLAAKESTPSPDGRSEQWKRDNTGGTIIVGRGAYKEYMAGLQEGWLGPLERPQAVQDEVDRVAEEERARLQKRKDEHAAATDGESQLDYQNQWEYEEDRQATINRKWPVVPPYISLAEVVEQDLPAEFALHTPEPISVFRLPHLLGFLMTPVRIFRWLNQRTLAEEMGAQAAGVVFAQTRSYDSRTDVALAETDEHDWPNAFKKKGLDNNSEWLRDFFVDPRISQTMSVYLPDTREHVVEPAASLSQVSLEVTEEVE